MPIYTLAIIPPLSFTLTTLLPPAHIHSSAVLAAMRHAISIYFIYRLDPLFPVSLFFFMRYCFYCLATAFAACQALPLYHSSPRRSTLTRERFSPVPFFYVCSATYRPNAYLRRATVNGHGARIIQKGVNNRTTTKKTRAGRTHVVICSHVTNVSGIGGRRQAANAMSTARIKSYAREDSIV